MGLRDRVDRNRVARLEIVCADVRGPKEQRRAQGKGERSRGPTRRPPASAEQAGEPQHDDAVRQKQDLSWKKYAKRLQEYLTELESLIWPDLIIIGGGISKESDQYLPLIKTQAKIIPAQLLNQAGIVGAAVYAHLQS